MRAAIGARTMRMEPLRRHEAGAVTL
jgi:hypothetical protein